MVKLVLCASLLALSSTTNHCTYFSIAPTTLKVQRIYSFIFGLFGVVLVSGGDLRVRLLVLLVLLIVLLLAKLLLFLFLCLLLVVHFLVLLLFALVLLMLSAFVNP